MTTTHRNIPANYAAGYGRPDISGRCATSTDADVFIVGAGPSGLTAACCLTRHSGAGSPSVIVIEQDPVYVGGISRTVRHKDFQFDLGDHNSIPQVTDLIDLWHDILPEDLVKRPRRSRIYQRGKYYSYPLAAPEILKNLGPFASAVGVFSYVYARLRPTRDARSFHDWGRNTFGERLFQTLFKTSAEKVWGLSCDELAADWAVDRIKGLDLGAAARATLTSTMWFAGAQPSNNEPGAIPAETVLSSRSGSGMRWQAAAAKIRAQGGQVLMGRQLRRLAYDAATQRWRIEVATAKTVETYTARHVISSAPVRDLVACLAAQAVSLFHARALRYRDAITVALIVKKANAYSDDRIYISDPAVKVGRIQNLGGELRPPDMSALGLEYFCFEGDSLWTAPDDDVIALARREIAQLGLAAEEDIVDGCVVRRPKARPIHDEDNRHNMAMIRLDLETHYPTLHLVGRNGMHSYGNRDRGMMSAMLTAQNILAGKRIHDLWDVRGNRAYHDAACSGMASASSQETGTLTGECAA